MIQFENILCNTAYYVDEGKSIIIDDLDGMEYRWQSLLLLVFGYFQI